MKTIVSLRAIRRRVARGRKVQRTGMKNVGCKGSNRLKHTCLQEVYCGTCDIGNRVGRCQRAEQTTTVVIGMSVGGAGRRRPFGGICIVPMPAVKVAAVDYLSVGTYLMGYGDEMDEGAPLPQAYHSQ